MSVNKCLSVAIIFAVLLLSSCGMKASRSSFVKSLDNIDSLIASSQTGEALKELSKTEKHARDPLERIGIFRRYMALGEKSRAENTLKKAIRHYRGNRELVAVYAHFLVRDGRVDDAEKVARPLKGTQYGAIYSEIYLTQLFLKEADEKPSFSDDSLFTVYYDAYIGTHEPYWLRNCALIRLLQGNYAGAMELVPEDSGEVMDAYFWALVCFDGKQFGQAAYFAERAEELYNQTAESGGAVKNGVSLLEITAILSDAYISQGDDESAEAVRQNLLSQLGDGSDITSASDEVRDHLLPVIYLDSALYAQSHGDDGRCLELLLNTVNTWRNYVPALIAYAAFARRTAEPLAEDEQEVALRKGGMRTLRMEKYDNRPRAAVSDARTRMEACLSDTYNAELYIALLDLRYATDKTLTIENKVTDVWSELEKSATGTNTYPPQLLEFAVNKLLTYGEEGDAWALFYKSLSATHGFDGKKDFWEQCVEKVRTFTVLEAEYAAYFAVKAQRAVTARRLLDYCVYESGGVAGGVDEKKVSSFVSTPTCMNLAMVCSSSGDKQKALDVYAAASGKAVDIKDKAEAMRRMAVIYAEQGSTKEARQSIGYALTLDPHNMRAKLLKDRLDDSM